MINYKIEIISQVSKIITQFLKKPSQVPAKNYTVVAEIKKLAAVERRRLLAEEEEAAPAAHAVGRRGGGRGGARCTVCMRIVSSARG